MHEDEVKTYKVRLAGAVDQWVAITAESFDVNEGAYRFWREGKQVASCERAQVVCIIEESHTG